MNFFKIHFSMFMGTLFWAGAFLAGKWGVASLSPLLLTFSRLGLAALILTPLAMKRTKEKILLDAKGWRYAFLAGLVGMVGYHLFFFAALAQTTATKAAVINASNPLLTALFATVLLRESLSLRKVPLLFLAFTGVLLTLTDWQPALLFSGGIGQGDLLMLVGTTAWALYAIIVRRALKGRDPLVFSTATFWAATLLLTLPASIEMCSPDFVFPSLPAILSVLYMAFFPTVIGYTIQQRAICQIGPAQTALYINLVPFHTMALSTLLLGEVFYLRNLFSGLMIMMAVVLFMKKTPSKKKRSNAL